MKDNIGFPSRTRIGWAGLLIVVAHCAALRAADLDTIGVTLLRQVDPSLMGNGVRVAQPEATSNGSDFEVNPAVVGLPVSSFTWISSTGTASVYPNSVGTESGHAEAVGQNFYGTTHGVAPQVSHIDNYEANYFISTFVSGVLQQSIPAEIVNQSFIFGSASENTANIDYDKYVNAYKTIFSSGVGNSGMVAAPGTAFNSIGVGLYGYASAYGPSSDGRCKPDLVAPDEANVGGSANSYSIPYVSGAAAILYQAALRGDGGSSSSMATNPIPMKALLLNGAVKPSDWTNSIIRPLDLRYGAGVLNVFNSWNQLKGQKRRYVETTSNTLGSPHPPGASASNEASLAGWDYSSITNPLVLPATYKEAVNHYYFQLPGTNAYTLTATLTWNRQNNQSTVNDLNLFLYNCANSNLVLCSTSLVDNVEHLFVRSLPPGRYDLQVEKNPTSQITPDEAYALAFEFFNIKLNIQRSGSQVLISWPIAPAGFRLLSTSSLNPPVNWTSVAATPAVSNGTNTVTVPASSGTQFFKLVRP